MVRRIPSANNPWRDFRVSSFSFGTAVAHTGSIDVPVAAKDTPTSAPGVMTCLPLYLFAGSGDPLGAVTFPSISVSADGDAYVLPAAVNPAESVEHRLYMLFLPANGVTTLSINSSERPNSCCGSYFPLVRSCPLLLIAS